MPKAKRRVSANAKQRAKKLYGKLTTKQKKNMGPRAKELVGKSHSAEAIKVRQEAEKAGGLRRGGKKK